MQEESKCHCRHVGQIMDQLAELEAQVKEMTSDGKKCHCNHAGSMTKQINALDESSVTRGRQIDELDQLAVDIAN